MRNKIVIVLTTILMIMSFNRVMGACIDCNAQNCGRCGYSCSVVNGLCVDADLRNSSTTAGDSSHDWWGKANSFWNGATSDVAKEAMETLNPIVTLIKTIGNMIFVAVTVVLGVKYIWGGVESKASVKDSLMTLVVAALVFYGWNTISALFMSGGTLSFISSDATTTVTSIYSTILYVCNFLAVGGIIYIGVRYMMAGAEGKSQLKAKGVPIVLGIIMVYATITFLNLIVGIL